MTPPGWLLPGKDWLLSGTGHAYSVTEEWREEFLNLIPPAIYLVTSSTLSTDRVTKSGFDLGISEDDQIWAKPELTVMGRARTDRIRAVSRRRGVRPRVHAGVDAGTSAARAVTSPRPAEDRKLDEVGRALKLVGLDHWSSTSRKKRHGTRCCPVARSKDLHSHGSFFIGRTSSCSMRRLRRSIPPARII